MTSTTTPAAPASPWPRRLALAAVLAAVPLVFFGGSVTTLHAGLAIDGWIVLEPGRGDHFLWLYPIDKWFRDVGTFVEHTHRLFGSLVGLLAIGTVVATWNADRRRLPRVLSLAALVAVVAQGAIGGLRVLEKSEDLAFLHGAIAQAVFAVLGASAIAASADFGGTARNPAALRAGRLGVLAIAATSSTYVQIIAGAWLRHGGGNAALAVHGVLAVLVVGCGCGLAAEMHRRAGELEPAARSRLLGLRRGILGLLAFQVALGVASLVVVAGPSNSGSGAPGLGSSVFPTLHVLAGGALFLACVAGCMWIYRIYPTPDASERPHSGRRVEIDDAGRLEVVR